MIHPMKHTSVDAQTLAAFVEEENVVDQLDEKSLADRGSKGVNHAHGHEDRVGLGLGAANEAGAVDEQGAQHHRPASYLMVQRNQQQGA